MKQTEPASPSQGNTSEAKSQLSEILHTAWTGGIAIQSNTARSKAASIAMAASSGLITTEVSPGCFCKRWFITSKGLTELENAQ